MLYKFNKFLRLLENFIFSFLLNLQGQLSNYAKKGELSTVETRIKVK